MEKMQINKKKRSKQVNVNEAYSSINSTFVNLFKKSKFSHNFRSPADAASQLFL